MTSFFEWTGTVFGSVCLAQMTTDVMMGSQPPWWAQFGVAIIICVGIIYLMIKYLAPKLDRIKEKVDINEQTLESLARSIEAALENNTETNKRLLDMLEKQLIWKRATSGNVDRYTDPQHGIESVVMKNGDE